MSRFTDKTHIPVRRRNGDEEHRMQAACVRWFGYAYPHLRGLLFAVPNGGRRDLQTGARLKEEGVVAGVADLILLAMRGGYGALLIEMKTARGRQSQSQRGFQQAAENAGYRYIVARSFDDFRHAVDTYLRLPAPADNSENSESSEHSDNSEYSEHSDNSEYSEHSDYSEYSDYSEQSDYSDLSDK